MNMIRVIVVDDERLPAEYLSGLLKSCDFEVVGCFINPVEALEKISLLKPDYLFLDIEMPELSGLELAEKVQANGFEGEVIFITAYHQYAIEAFKVNALDYLLKPVTREELEHTMNRLKKRFHPLQRNLKPQTLHLKITLLGAFAVYAANGDALHWTTSKCAELFAFMLLQKGAEISKGRLMDILWPDKNSEKADVNLRSTLSRLNKTLRENGVPIAVSSTVKGYGLLSDKVEYTVDAFELEKLSGHTGKFDSSEAQNCFRVLSQYQGPLLENMEGEWCEAFRSSFHMRYLSVSKKLLAYYIGTDTELLNAMNIIETLTRYEPYDETVQEWGLRLQYRLIGRQGADAYYKKYQKLIYDELGIEPGEKLKRLHRKLLSEK